MDDYTLPETTIGASVNKFEIISPTNAVIQKRWIRQLMFGKVLLVETRKGRFEFNLDGTREALLSLAKVCNPGKMGAFNPFGEGTPENPFGNKSIDM